MNKNMLTSAMKAYGDSGATLADYLGISRTTLSAKLNGKSDFVQGEIIAIKSRYGLTPEQIDVIFFNL